MNSLLDKGPTVGLLASVMEASDRAAGSRYLLIDRDSGLVKFGDSPNFGDVDYNIPGVHSDFVPVYKKASLLLTLEAIRLEECCN